MLKKAAVLVFFLLLLIFNRSNAQSDTLKWYPGLKLKLSDFTIEHSAASVYPDVIVQAGYTYQPTKFGKFLPIVHAEAILNRKTSSLPDSGQNNLRLAQLLFDLSGYQSLLVKLKTFELGELNGHVDQGNATMDQVFFQSNTEVSQLKKQMMNDLYQSDNAQKLADWEMKINDLIRNTPEIVEEKRVGDVQLGLFVGVARSFFTNKTKEHFTDATGVNFGFNVDVKRSRFVIDLNLDFNKTKSELESNGAWPTGMKTHFASIELTYGFKFAKNKWLTVPYTGLSINEFTPAKSSRDDERRLVGYSPVVGLELDRYFGSSNDSRESAKFFYRIRASVNPSNLIKDYGGTQFNLKLAVGFDAAKVKTRLVKKE